MEGPIKKEINNIHTNADFNYGDQFPTTYLNGESDIIYYGVHIPPDVQVQDSDGYINVYEDRIEALKVVKKYKKARFKAFHYYHEAAEFAVHGSEYPNNNSGVDVVVQKEQVQNVGEKPSQFRGPTSQNLVKLRKGIECGDIYFVQKTIWDNPRYLIGAGDTPSILQEGFRYNGLHVAAKSKNSEMCELILNTISNIKFIKKLYVDDKDPEDRAKILLDLYLNTPDKGLHETPLHFAAKFGAYKCVEVLVSFAHCDKNLRNKHGKFPNQIICDRYDGPDSRKISGKIALLLQDNYYVPVLRSEDNCAPPQIGEPFSPTSPPNFNRNPLDPRLEIHAYAGPMDKEGAEKFRRLWKNPFHSLNLGSPLKSFMNKSIDTIASIKMKDHEKGLERVGYNLAKDMEIGWKEYWPFLDSFVDITSPEGLELLEAYLAEKVSSAYKINTSPMQQNSIDSPQNLSGSNSPLKLGAEISPMSELCNALQACTINDRRYSNFCDVNQERDVSNDLSPFSCIDKSLQVFAKRISNDILYLLDFQFDTCILLEMQIKQLQLLMGSYMDDSRFICVDIHLVHSRLSYLVKSIVTQNLQDFKLLEKKIDLWLEFYSKNYDCFSSDDEGVQSTIVHSKNQHTMCILKHVQEYLLNDVVFEDVKSEEDCVLAFKQLKTCNCTWKKASKKNFTMSKRWNSCKFSMRNPFKQDLARKLSFGAAESDMFCTKPYMLMCNGDEGDSSEEEFYTPPTSPNLLEEDKSGDEQEVFDETNLPDIDIFIEGDIPTKVDCAVYNALNIAECKLNSVDYPNIYKWKHAVSLYKERDRKNWSAANVICNVIGPQVTSTPVRATNEPSISPTYAPPKSWLRVTGANSPRASLKSHKGNVSFNL